MEHADSLSALLFPEGALALFHRAAVCIWIPLCLGTVAFERPGPLFRRPRGPPPLCRRRCALRFPRRSFRMCRSALVFSPARSCGGLSAWAALPGFSPFGAALRLCSGAAVLLSLLRCSVCFFGRFTPRRSFFHAGRPRFSARRPAWPSAPAWQGLRHIFPAPLPPAAAPPPRQDRYP